MRILIYGLFCLALMPWQELIGQISVNELLLESIKEKNRHPYMTSQTSPPQEDVLGLRSAQEIKFTNSQNASSSEGEPYIAVNPNDSNHLVLSYMDLTTTLNMPVYYSYDGGASWEQSPFSTLSAFDTDTIYDNHVLVGGGDPVLVFDDDHTLYFSWITLGINTTTSLGKFALWWAYSEDGGQSFTLAPGHQHFISRGSVNLLTGAIGTYGDGVFDRNWLDVDLSKGPYHGTLYCAGQYFAKLDPGETASGISLRTKRAGAISFENQNKKISPGAATQFTNIGVDGSGNVHVIYGNLEENLIAHQVSKDGGFNFSTPHTISSFEYIFNGNKLIHNRENPVPSLAIDKSDNSLHVAWTSYGSDQVVTGYYSSSTDLGETWSRPMALTDLAGSEFKHSMMPAVATNASGDLSVGWYALTDRLVSDFYAAQKKKGNDHFDVAELISSNSTNFRAYDANDPISVVFFWRLL